MREIKFRGKRVDNGEWVYGSLIICSLRYGSGYLIHTYALNEENKDEEIEVYHPTIGQYTGLKDKNVKEIYEGDIAVYYNRKGVIVYDEKRAAFCLFTEADNVYVQLECTVVIDIEVTGNIY